MQAGRFSLLWLRVTGVAVTAAGLYLVFRRLKFAALAETLGRMRPGWFIAGILLYGLLFVPACLRWRLLLRLIGTDLPTGPLARVYLIGHFFYVVLFGAVGGDTARSALCARWYRLPLASILATAPLDRLLGFMGLVAFGGTAFGIAYASGGLSRLVFSFQPPGWWIFLIVAVIFLAGWFVWRTVAGRSLKQFWEALRTGARLLFASPGVALSGATCGLLVQAILSIVLAFNLQAVSHEPLPWTQMAWAFPVISVSGALPVTVGGLGARDSVALYLFGLYGVASAAAVGASLLTFVASVFWAIIGALFLLWEFSRQRLLSGAAVGR